MDVFHRTFSSTHPLHTPADAQADDGRAAVELDELYLPPKSALAAFATLTRAGATVSLAMPALIGMVLAWWATGLFELVIFFFTLIGALLTAVGFTLLTEYFDFRRSNEIDDAGLLEPCVGSYCLIIHHLFPAGAIRLFAWLSLLISGGCAAALTYAVGWPVLFFFGMQLLIGFALVLAPLRLAWRGWGMGEVGAFLSFGLLATLNGYYVQTHRVDSAPLWAAIPLGLLAVVVIHNGNLVYYRRDWLARKRTLAVHLGILRGLDLSAALSVLAFVAVVLLVSLSRLPLWSLAILGALPVTLGSFSRIRREYVNSEDCLAVYRSGVHAALLTGVLFIAALTLDGLLGS